jgi:hypothetical protein
VTQKQPRGYANKKKKDSSNFWTFTGKFSELRNFVGRIEPVHKIL